MKVHLNQNKKNKGVIKHALDIIGKSLVGFHEGDLKFFRPKV
jgi:hypothetical protein